MAQWAFGQTSAESNATSKPIVNNSSTKCSQPSSTIEPSSHPCQKLKQATLKTYQGVDMPFSQEETVAVQAQVLKAIVSANLSFWAMENPEMLKLFGMLWIAVLKIIPSKKVIGGQLLDETLGIVDSMLRRILTGKNLGLSYNCNDTRTICSADFGIVGLMDGNLSWKMPWMVFVQMWISKYVHGTCCLWCISHTI